MNFVRCLIFADVSFVIGATTIFVRRSAVTALIGVEMILNATNLVLVTLAHINSNADGGTMAFFAMVVAAAEVVIGLSIIVSIYRSHSITSMGDLNLLKN